MTASCTSALRQFTLSRRIVDRDSRLNIVNINTEQDSVAFVLHRFRFHQDSGCHKVISLKDRRHAVHHMVSGFFYIVGCQVLKRQHSLNIKVSRTRDQILFVRVLRSQLVSDQMASVIQIFSIHKIIFRIDPPCWLYLADRTALFRRHRIGTDGGISHTAAA